MIQLIKEGIKTTIGGSYDYVDVRDVVLGLLKALELKKFGERYILSGGLLKMGDYVSYLKEFTGIQADTRLLGYKTSLVIAFFSELFNKNSTITWYTVHTLHANTNISHRKATNDLGYSPRSVKESIKDQYEWFKLNGYLNEK